MACYSGATSNYLFSNFGLLTSNRETDVGLCSPGWKPPLFLHAQGFLCVRQLPCRSEAPSQCPLLYRECVLSLHSELLNHLLTTAWRELRQWLVNTPEWMKGLGIKWQDVLKEEQVVVEEGPAKPCRSGTSCVSLSFSPPLRCFPSFRLRALSALLSIFHTRLPRLVPPLSFPSASISLSLSFLSLLSSRRYNQRSLLLNSGLRQLTFMRLDIQV